MDNRFVIAMNSYNSSTDTRYLAHDNNFIVRYYEEISDKCLMSKYAADQLIIILENLFPGSDLVIKEVSIVTHTTTEYYL
jgi:hypothetical protein